MKETTQEFLLEILEYDESSGKLFWKPRGIHLFTDGVRWSAESKCSAFNRRFGGREAFTATDKYGYNVSTLLGKTVFAHRIIWLMKTGKHPSGHVDHSNGVRDDNRWDNLRDISPSENSRNTADNSRSSSGKTGVTWSGRDSKWRVRIGVGSGKRVELGLFGSFGEAVRVRERAEIEYGYTSRHGFS